MSATTLIQASGRLFRTVRSNNGHRYLENNSTSHRHTHCNSSPGNAHAQFSEHRIGHCVGIRARISERRAARINAGSSLVRLARRRLARVPAGASERDATRPRASHPHPHAHRNQCLLLLARFMPIATSHSLPSRTHLRSRRQVFPTVCESEHGSPATCECTLPAARRGISFFMRTKIIKSKWREN